MQLREIFTAQLRQLMQALTELREGIDLTQSGPMQSVFDKDALENELNKNYGNGMNFQQIGE